MARKTSVFVVLFLFAAALIALTPSEIKNMIPKADQLTGAGQYGESQKILMDVYKADPENKEVYWMIARNYYFIGELLPKNKEQEKLDAFIQCQEWANKGKAKDPNVAGNYFFSGVGMGQESVIRGIFKSLNKAKTTEDLFLKTLAMHPTYKSDWDSIEGGANLALCQFYRKVPDKAIMQWLYKTRGNLDKSVSYCQAALKILPDRIDYNKEMGVALICRGNKKNMPADVAEGKNYLEKAIGLPAKTEINKFDQADSKRLLADPKLACGYSRSKQEEVTEVK